MSVVAARYAALSAGASSSRTAMMLPSPARSLSTTSSTSSTSTSNGAFQATLPTSFAATSPSASSSSPSSTPQQTVPHLSWDKYLQLRRSRRLAGMVTTIPTTFLAGAAAGSYFLTLELDPTNTIAGLDPVYINAGLTLASAGLGWLVGPTVGSSMWSLLHRSNAKQIAQKDHDFYEHIKRNRVDPTRQSVQNPVPDYYGEKIGSIKQYRQWLRDQAAFRRKAAHGLEQDA